MKQFISSFLEQKSLSANSRLAYAYDLEQFIDIVQSKISEMSLQIYQTKMLSRKPSVQRRKISAVNQFLLYLYREGNIATFYQLEAPKGKTADSRKADLLDLSDFWHEAKETNGRMIALLILETGLLPSELLHLKQADIQLDFQIIQLEKKGQKRIIELSLALVKELERFMQSGIYLFEKNGKSYTRQWIFRQLEAFLAEKNQKDLSAQSLREQYILRQRAQGVELYDIARQLGLKTILTLEKYR